MARADQHNAEEMEGAGRSGAQPWRWRALKRGSPDMQRDEFGGPAV